MYSWYTSMRSSLSKASYAESPSSFPDALRHGVSTCGRAPLETAALFAWPDMTYTCARPCAAAQCFDAISVRMCRVLVTDCT